MNPPVAIVLNRIPHVISATFVILLLLAAGCTAPQVPAAGQTGQPPEVTASQPDDSHIVVTYQGGPSMESLIELETTITDSQGRSQTKSAGNRLGTTPIPIGGTNSISGNYAGLDHVVVMGYFSDGSHRQMLDTTL